MTSRSLRGLAGCCLLVVGILVVEPGLQAAEADHAKPSLVIPIAPLGYGPPGELYLTLRYSHVSLDFVDADHLLFTFQKKELLRHSTDERPDDDDQLIQAVVLQLPEGKVSASADWRMHDRQRYLWPLGLGTFLVRQRDSLFLTDSSLELRPYGRFPGRLAAVQVSPGGDLLVAQTEESLQPVDKPAGLAQDAAADSPQPNSKPVLLRVFRVKDRAVIAQSRVQRPINMPISDSGFAESVEKKHNQWTLNFTPLTAGSAPAVAKPVAEVSSTCPPYLLFVGGERILAIRCSQFNDRVATFLSLDGKLLWDYKWRIKGVWPTWARSQDGSRFAQGILTGPAGLGDAIAPQSSEISGQRVEVLDTASGKLLLSAPATPVYDAGQNFALSADGQRFAILHAGAIEIYDLPAAAR